MPRTSYHGEYTSTTVSGCVKSFMSQESGDASFPPSVEKACDLCNKVHLFKLSKTHMVSTDSQRETLASHCKTNDIQADVIVPLQP